MSQNVGSIYTEFLVKGLGAAMQSVTKLTQMLDKLDGRKINIGSGGGVGDELKKGADAAEVNSKRIIAALNAPRQAMDGLSKGLGNIAQGLEHTGQVFSIFGYRAALVTAPLVALGAAGAQATIQLENSVRLAATQLDNLSPSGVQKFVDTTTTQLRKLSTEIPQDANDMAQAMYYLVSTLTIKPETASQFVQPLAEFATAIDDTTLTATKSVVPILNVFKEYATGADGLNKVLAMVFNAIQRGSGAPGDIARQFGQFAESAKLANASLSETLAMYAQLTRVAGTPAEASTQLNMLFKEITNKDNVTALKELGIETSQIVEGTGQWVTSTEALNSKQESTYKSIQTKLAGDTGVTGLYKTLVLQQNSYNNALDAYNAKATTSNANTLERAQFNLQTTQAEIANLESQKAALTGANGQVYTGQSVRVDPLTILDQIKAKMDTLKSDQEKLDLIGGLFPNIRGERGVLGLFESLDTVHQWVAENETGTSKVANAYQIMRESIQNELKLLQSSVLAATGQIFDEQLAPKLKPLLDTISKFVASLMNTPAAFKEFVVQFTLLGAALGPLSLVVGTVLIGLGELVSIVAVLVSPVGIIALTAAFLAFGPAFTAFKNGINDAGGGMQGFVRLIAELAVQLGLIQRADAVKTLQDLGVKADDIGTGFGKLHDDVATFITDLHGIQTNIQNVVDILGKVAQFLQDNPWVIYGLAAEMAISKIIGLLGIGGLLGAIGGIAPAFEVAAASAGAFSAMPLIAAALAGAAIVVPILIKMHADDTELRAAFDRVVPGFFGNANLSGSPSSPDFPVSTNRPLAPNTSLPLTTNTQMQHYNDYPGDTFPNEPYRDWTLENTRTYDLRQDDGSILHITTDPRTGKTTTKIIDTVQSNLQKNTGNNAPTFTDQGLSAAWAAQNATGYDEIYGPSGVNQASFGSNKRPATSAPTGGSIPTATGFGGRPALANIPSGSDVLDRLGGKAWTGAFAQEHNGQDPYSFYAGQGYSDPAAAALRDKSWGDQFAQQNGGKGPSKGDWEAHWYQTYDKTQTDELDAAGKPTGKKKTTISGPVDEFTQAVKDAFKGLTDKKDDLTKAYTDPAQALIDKKTDITKAYTDPAQAFQDMLTDIITTIDNLRARIGATQGGGTTPPSGGTTGGTTGTGTGAFDIGGNVQKSGIYRLLKGEHVLTMPDQMNLAKTMANATHNYQGDNVSISINGANANAREIADEVLSRLRIEKARRGTPRMAY